MLIYDVEYDRLVSHHVRNALDHHEAIIACMLGYTDMYEVRLIYIVRSHLITLETSHSFQSSIVRTH